MKTKFKLGVFATAFSLSMTPGIASASLLYLGNFDVVNDTGSTAYGFEIELEGLSIEDIHDTFGGAGRSFPSGKGFDRSSAVVRYGAPSLRDIVNPDGSSTTFVRYAAEFINGAWDFSTPSGIIATPGDNCWTGGGIGYSADTPCDHFGVGTLKNPTKTTYSWLLDDSQSGQLTKSNGQVSLPAPVISPPAQVPAGQQPNVVANIAAPAPENNIEFGDAIWVKVFKTELDREVELEELIAGNQIIDNAETEIEWQLLQVEFSKPDSGQLESGYQNGIGANAESVIFHYEFYKYGGQYDPQSHEADPAGNDSNPGLGDLGAYMGAQNNALNLNALVPVPVSPSFIFMGTGLLGFIANRRRLLKKQSVSA